MIKDRVATEIGLVTGRIKQTVRNGKDSLSELQTSVTDNTRRAMRRTDYYVHDNAWKLLGIAAGAAFVAGFLLPRRTRDAVAMASGDLSEARVAKKVNSWEFVHSALPLALFLWKAVQASRCARKGMV